MQGPHVDLDYEVGKGVKYFVLVFFPKQYFLPNSLLLHVLCFFCQAVSKLAGLSQELSRDDLEAEARKSSHFTTHWLQ